MMKVGMEMMAVNGATLTTDRNGNTNSAYYFDGSESYIDLGSHDMFNFNESSFSITFWIKAAIQDSTVLSKGVEGSSGKGWNIQCENTTGLGEGVRLDLSDGNTIIKESGSVNTGTEVFDGEWHYITFKLDRALQEASVYLDGVQKESIDISSLGNINSDQNLWIGRRGGGDWHIFNGSLDDIRVYNRALSGAEIQTLYNEESTVDIQANNLNWTATGVYLSVDDTLAITATGLIRICCGTSPLIITPDGYTPPNVNSYPAPDLNAYSLIGKIGQDGAPFFVGSNYSGVINTEGELYLIVNDDVHSDNTGYFTVITSVYTDLNDCESSFLKGYADGMATCEGMFTQEQIDQAVADAEAVKDQTIFNLNATITNKNLTISELTDAVNSMYTDEQINAEITKLLTICDLNGDGKIGLEEAIQALRIVANSN